MSDKIPMQKYGFWHSYIITLLVAGVAVWLLIVGLAEGGVMVFLALLGTLIIAALTEIVTVLLRLTERFI